jgi:hypothetical protein
MACRRTKCPRGREAWQDWTEAVGTTLESTNPTVRDGGAGASFPAHPLFVESRVIVVIERKRIVC